MVEDQKIQDIKVKVKVEDTIIKTSIIADQKIQDIKDKREGSKIETTKDKDQKDVVKNFTLMNLHQKVNLDPVDTLCHSKEMRMNLMDQISHKTNPNNGKIAAQMKNERWAHAIMRKVQNAHRIMKNQLQMKKKEICLQTTPKIIL